MAAEAVFTHHQPFLPARDLDRELHLAIVVRSIMVEMTEVVREMLAAMGG